MGSESSKEYHFCSSKREFVKLLKVKTDYISDSIKIAWINDKKGRGIIATEDIKNGEFLLREKCFAFGFPPSEYKYYNNKNPSICEEFGFPHSKYKGSVSCSVSKHNLCCDMMNKYVNG